MKYYYNLILFNNNSLILTMNTNNTDFTKMFEKTNKMKYSIEKIETDIEQLKKQEEKLSYKIILESDTIINSLNTEIMTNIRIYSSLKIDTKIKIIKLLSNYDSYSFYSIKYFIISICESYKYNAIFGNLKKNWDLIIKVMRKLDKNNIKIKKEHKALLKYQKKTIAKKIKIEQKRINKERKNIKKYNKKSSNTNNVYEQLL